MRRKIPGKKHRGVKDPLKQRHDRNEKLKQVINCPPSNPNIQEIPKSVLEINRLRELVKTGNFKKKKQKNKQKLLNESVFPDAQLPGVKKKEKLLPRLKQNPGESDRQFLWRVDQAANEIINEVHMKAKHEVKEDKANERKSSSFSQGHGKKPKHSTQGNNILDKKERMKLRKKIKQAAKKLNRVKVNEDAIEKKKDVIAFGDVAHQPPQLSKRPKGCVIEKPGCKDLLLKHVLNPKKSMADTKRIAEERERAIVAYREMKKRNRQLAHQSLKK